MRGYDAARKRLLALEERIGGPAVPLPPTFWQLRDEMRQTLENAHSEGLLLQAPRQIGLLYKVTPPDSRGTVLIDGGKRAEAWGAEDQLERNDRARFNFAVVVRYSKGFAPELISYHFNLSFEAGHAPSFVRFDYNDAAFANASRDPVRSPLRCHSHPGHASMTVPSPVLSPVETLDILLRHHLRA